MREAERKAEELEAMREQELNGDAAAEALENGDSENAATTSSSAGATTARSTEG